MGATTPIGFDAKTTSIHFLAGIGHFSQTPWLNDHLMPDTLSTIPNDCFHPLEPYEHRRQPRSDWETRLLQLSVTALEEIPPSYPAMPLFLGLPEASAGKLEGQTFLRDLAHQADFPIQVSKSRAFTFGRSAGHLALEEAVQCIRSKTHACVLVGSVDSYYNRDRLMNLFRAYRIKSTLTTDYFTPGEGAGFIIVCTRHMAEEHKWLIKGALEAISSAEEKGTLDNQTQSKAIGFGNCLNTVKNQMLIDVQSVQHVYTSCNGESFFDKEMILVRIRQLSRWSENSELIRVADRLKDTGAGYGIISLIIALQIMAFEGQDKPALILSASDGSERAAVVLTGIKHGTNHS